jgi:hypothetical protein
MDFETALFAQLNALPTWTPTQARLAKMIERGKGTPPLVVILEQHVRAKLGYSPTETIDWATGTPPKEGVAAIDWASLLAFIEALLPVLLPILLPLL